MAIILVVDDEVYMRSFLTDLISEKYNVLCASNGQEALLIAQSIYPDLIITDLEMPIMSGLEMVKILRYLPRQEKVPVIALSADFNIRIKREIMLNAGANFCLPKPINIGLLHRKIAQLLNTKEIVPLSLGLGEIYRKENFLEKTKTF
ncbi:MAG: response regulator [Acidobacteria bacterium]|nr:response regulator [Acidobacteriota bacterium]